MALTAIQRRVLADHLKIRVRFVARFALIARHHARLPGLRMDDATVAIGAQHVLRHVHGVVDLDRLVLKRGCFGVTGEALIVLDADDDLNRHFIIAGEMRDQLFRAARFFFDEPAHARLGVTIQARGFGSMCGGLPRAVVEIHFVASVAEPGLGVDPLEPRAADNQHQKYDDTYRSQPKATATIHRSSRALKIKSPPTFEHHLETRKAITTYHWRRL
jgi:hypothetical protein